MAASPTDFVCDVCTEIPEPADSGRTYAFSIRDDVRFEDGSVLTAYDVAASWNKIVDPPKGVISARRGYYSMIQTIEAPGAKTVVFRLKIRHECVYPGRIRSRSTIARLDSRAEHADTAWSEVQCKRAEGVAIRPRVAASDPNIEDPERPSSSFPRRPHGEPDLLTKGELERMAVGVGNPRGIANGVARIDRRSIDARRPARPVDRLCAPLC
jgi:hypothetical protein